MYKIISDLLADKESWRVQSFIDKMEDFKKQCTTNEQEDLIRDVLACAKRVQVEVNGGE